MLQYTYQFDLTNGVSQQLTFRSPEEAWEYALEVREELKDIQFIKKENVNED